MSIKKSSIQQAILEAREIEKFANEKARKSFEEEMAPKIKQVANEALKEFEKNSLSEGMNLEIPAGAELTIKMPEDGTSEIEVPSEEEEKEIETPGDVNPETEETTNNEEDMSDIFEIEGLNEVDGVQPEATATADTATPIENPAPADATPNEEPASLESINQKLDDLLGKVNAITSDESADQGEGEGDVSIIEDEPEAENTTGELPAPTENPAPAPVQESGLTEEADEVVYEVEDDNSGDDDLVEYQLEEDDNEDMSDINTESVMEMFNELEGIDEIELVDEDEEGRDASMDEMLGVSFAAKKRADRRQYENINESINKIKAQYVSKVDELRQENVSLKQTIKEYKDSFIVLRKQINEVQIFNAKLAYANKLFTNGGLTNDEKMKIAEEFDSVETIEEAKKLYNNLLNEMKGSKSPKTTSVDKLKSVNPAVIKPSNTQTLYESDEMRRMKRLAGIGKNSEE
jgi:hypothetical protein